MMEKPDFRRLPFWREDNLVGHLIQDDAGNFSFAYAESWRGEAISPLLPLDGSAPSKDVRCWFRELMPDERRRKAFESLTRLSLQRIGEFLHWHGEDLPGDLSVRPAYESGEPRDISRLITMTVGAGGSIDRAAMGSSLGGCDPKVAVIARKIDGNLAFFSATSANPSTHILKASGLVAAMEDISTMLARKTGLFPVTNLEPVAIRRMPCLLIERYDRIAAPDGHVRKLAQEDFCQASGNLKRYGSDDGGVDMEKFAEIVRKRLDRKNLEIFLRMSFYSMLIGNSDDHAGNYALLESPEGKWNLAPAYDLVSVASLKEMSEKGIFAGSPMLAFLSLKQPRKFGRHYDDLEIGGEDAEIAAGLFGMAEEEIGMLAMECHDRVLESLSADFLTEMKDRWETLDLDEDFSQLAEDSIRAFGEAVLARTETLGKVFGEAFGINHSTGPGN